MVTNVGHTSNLNVGCCDVAHCGVQLDHMNLLSVVIWRGPEAISYVAVAVGGFLLGRKSKRQ